MFNFNNKLNHVIKNIALHAKNSDTNIYFVGGMVRDELMSAAGDIKYSNCEDVDLNAKNSIYKDIDILIEGSAIDFIEDFYENFKDRADIEIKSCHKSFNTAKTVIDGIEIDFASSRTEYYPLSGCLPVVKNTGCSINDDLKRRDFTVNSVAARIIYTDNGIQYDLVDPFDGVSDIKNKLLRTLHHESYRDDPTRILRGLDFKLRFGFKFTDKDKELIERYLKNPDREGLSLDRVKLTIKKLFSDCTSDNMAKMAYNYILDCKLYKIWQDEPSAKSSWFGRLSDAARIFNLNFSDVFFNAFFNSEKYVTKCNALSNYEIYKFFTNFNDVDLALQYGILNDKNGIHYYKNLRNVKLKVSGNDLLNLGFMQGKTIGEALEALLKEKLNNPSKFLTKEDEINFVKLIKP